MKAYAAGLAYGGLYYVLPENATASSDVTAENGTVVSGDWLEQHYPGQSGSFATIEKGYSPNRYYRLYGRETLDSTPIDVTSSANDLSRTDFRFFHVGVSLHPPAVIPK